MLENRGTPANLAKCAMTMGKTSAKRQPSMQSIRGFETSDGDNARSDDLTPTRTWLWQCRVYTFGNFS